MEFVYYGLAWVRLICPDYKTARISQLLSVTVTTVTMSYGQRTLVLKMLKMNVHMNLVKSNIYNMYLNLWVLTVTILISMGHIHC